MAKGQLVWPRRIRQRAARCNGTAILAALESPKAQEIAAEAVHGDGLVLFALASILADAMGGALSDEQKKLAGEATAFLVEEYMGVGVRTVKRVLRANNSAGFASCMRFELAQPAKPVVRADQPVEQPLSVDGAIKILVAAMPTDLLALLKSAIAGELRAR